MTNPGQDPRLLPSTAHAKAADVEARLAAHLSAHPAAPPALTYGQNQGQVTQAGNGTYTWTCPAGVTAAKIECWGAGAGGGGGGSTRGGEGGGGGEYASEPAYPVVPGVTYSYIVGNGGSGGTTGNGGQDGGATLFDTSSGGGGTTTGGVFANGGGAGSGFTGGPGGGTAGHGGPGTGTIENHGGNGGGNGSQGTGGCGGGAPAGPNASGANGITSSGSSGASGGTGGGGNGGASGANGSNGSTPGAGGGGAGAATAATSGTSTYRLNSSATYFGSDATGGNANQKRADGTMWQGGETASGGSYNGTQKALGIIGGNPQGDLSGKTIDQVSIRLEWTHTWYNNGAYVILGYTNRSSLPSSWNAGGITGIKTWWQGNVGGTVTTDLTGQGLGSALQSGAAQSVSLGPGSSFNLNNYGSAYGAGGDNGQNPLITVNWHTGAAPVQAGGGADGKVVITYFTAGVLLAALQPAAGTDTAGNAFAAGYTGPVTAVQPGTSPSAAETWHDFPPGANGWGLGSGGWKKYRSRCG
jgi:hypothetical protein